MNDPHRFDDLFEPFGPVRLRRFFGGEGIYAGDVMIGMIFFWRHDLFQDGCGNARGLSRREVQTVLVREAQIRRDGGDDVVRAAGPAL
jgi:hypothetical protein